MKIRWTWCLLLVATMTLAACSNTGGGGPGPNTPQAQSATSPNHIFLEVGPQRKACNLGREYGTQCLQVRELRYDSNGLQTFTGHWEDFFGEINGYKHEAGVSHVLRMNRYQGKNSAGYVLDKVVSSTAESQLK